MDFEDDSMETGFLTDPTFDWTVFDRVVEVKSDLVNRRNIEESFSYLSSTPLSVTMLNTTLVEIAVQNCASEVPISFEPICGYLLRKWERQRDGRTAQKSPARRLLPRRDEKIRDVVKAEFSEYKFHLMRKRKTYCFNKKVGAKSLKDLCRAKVQNSIHASARRKSVIPLLSLLRRISPEALERLETAVPAVAEVADRLWEAMLYLHFRGRCPPLTLSYKEAYFYFLNRRRMFEDELLKISIPQKKEAILEKKEDVSIKRLAGRLILYLAHIFSS